MRVSENVELIRRLFGLLDKRDLEGLAALIAPNMVRHDLGGAYPGVTGENVQDFLAELLRGVPDLQMNIQDLFGVDDRVVVRFKMEGTHAGEVFGRSGSGNAISVNAINIYRIAGGQVAETWQLQDLAGFFDQIDAS